MEFKSIKFEQSMQKSQTKASLLRQQLNSVKSMKSMINKTSAGRSKKEEQQFGYTADAVKRTEQRRLERFINVADLRMCDAIYEVLKASVQVYSGFV